jgi:carboxynorspermidine decarboxylase
MNGLAGMMPIDFAALPTPCYIVDERLLARNLDVLDGIQRQTGCKILLALKGYSLFATFPLIGRYLAGVTASSRFEARLGREEMGKEVHIYAPAYVEEDFPAILADCDHIIFNSFSQWRHYRSQVGQASQAGLTGSGHAGRIECGLRINPEYSEIKTAIYDPCGPYSRLGITADVFQKEVAADPGALNGINGLHAHCLCEQNSDTLARLADVIDLRFGPYIGRMSWLNLGGGHLITRPGYDRATLVRTIEFFQQKYGVQVYLEPGEAIVLNTGYLVAKVLDIVENGMPIAIIDSSAACHMPDVLEMPYRPEVAGAGKPGELAWTCRIGGLTCLAGDVIGDYSFPRPLKPGDHLVFMDMAHYTMVKNNTFNGVALPAIALYNDEAGLRIIRRFGYPDFKNRLS